jgi:purine-binding chemotaxis protein CheW
MTGPFAEMGPEERDLLEARAAELAAVEEPETGETLGALVVSVQDDRYALPLPAVREVVSEYQLTPVPCAPHAVRGVINLRGEIVSVTDLGILLGLRAETVVRRSPLVVLTDGAVTTALLVDAVTDIAHVPGDAMTPPLAVADRVHADAVSGSFQTEGGPVALLEPAALLVPVGGEV